MNKIKNNAFSNIFLKVMLLVAIAVAALAFSTADSHATATIDGLKQTNASSSSVNIEWTSIIGNGIKYEVILSDTTGSSTTDGIGYASQYLYGLSAGKSYNVKVNAYTGSGTSKSIVAESPTIEVVTTPNEKANVAQLSTGSSTSSIQLKNYAVTGANYYEILYYRSDLASPLKKTIRTTSTSYKLTGLTANKTYRVYITPLRRSASGFVAVGTSGTTSDYSALGVVPSKMTGVKLDTFYPYTNVAYFTWTRVDAATGYQYYVYDSTGKKRITSGDITGYSIFISNKLKINNFYRVKVRAYRRINGVTNYGAWSTTRAVSGGSKTVRATKRYGSLSLSWDKVYGATSYSVYISTKKPTSSSLTGMTNVKTTSNRSYKLTKFKGYKISTKKTYYVVVVANKKIGTTTYRSTPYGYFIK